MDYSLLLGVHYLDSQKDLVSILPSARNNEHIYTPEYCNLVGEVN